LPVTIATVAMVMERVVEERPSRGTHGEVSSGSNKGVHPKDCPSVSTFCVCVCVCVGVCACVGVCVCQIFDSLSDISQNPAGGLF